MAGNVAIRQSAALVFINSDSGEGYVTVDGNEGDRSVISKLFRAGQWFWWFYAPRNNLTAWHDGDALVLAVAAQNNNTIVIVHSVGPLIMEPWIEHPNVTAVRTPAHAHTNSNVTIDAGTLGRSIWTGNRPLHHGCAIWWLESIGKTAVYYCSKCFGLSCTPCLWGRSNRYCEDQLYRRVYISRILNVCRQCTNIFLVRLLIDYRHFDAVSRHLHFWLLLTSAFFSERR